MSKKKLTTCLMGLAIAMSSVTANAAPNKSEINIDLNGGLADNTSMFVLLTVLMMAPSLIACFTPFVRYIITISFLKNALGTQQVPPSIVVTGLALIMTIFTMQPTFNTVKKEAIEPFKEKQITQEQMITNTSNIMKGFMLKHTKEKYLVGIAEFAGVEKLPDNKKDLDFWVIAPAYLINEITVAFAIGCLFYIIFIAIDMIVAIVLNAMGMVMMPPMTISIMIKLLVFVTADGWFNVIQTLLSGYK